MWRTSGRMKGPRAVDDAPRARARCVTRSLPCRGGSCGEPRTRSVTNAQNFARSPRQIRMPRGVAAHTWNLWPAQPRRRNRASKRRCHMQRNTVSRTRVPRTAVIICAVIIAAAGAAAAGWRISQHPRALPKASCGSASTHFLNRHTRLFGSGPGSLTCFIKAAHVCASASLHVTEMGVDAGTEYVFSIEPSGSSCHVTEWRQDYSANFGGSQSEIATAPCRRTAVTSKAVLLTCSGRDVLIPANVSAPSPQRSATRLSRRIVGVLGPTILPDHQVPSTVLLINPAKGAVLMGVLELAARDQSAARC
jgi:hypothetical protein